MSTSRRVGAHLSAAGGYTKAVDRAVEIGADTLQIFSGSPRVWKRPEIRANELQSFQEYAHEHNIRPLFVHALYLINLVSDKTELVQKSVKTLIYELEFAQHFGGSGVILHIGSHQGRGWEASREALAVTIQHILAEADSEVPLLMENAAGQKGKVGSDLSEIAWLLREVNHPQLGWCYDTCHGWSAGYAVTDVPDKQSDLVSTLDEHELWGSLGCLHVNDSRDPYASGKDRHANMLEGSIPESEWRAIFGLERWRDVPIISEVPGFGEAKQPDAENMRRIRELL